MTNLCRICRKRIDARTIRAGGEVCFDCASTTRVEPDPINPTTGEPFNTARAARVQDAIAAYAAQCYGTVVDRADHATVAQDFLTDALHWMHQRGVVPGDIAQRAINMFQEEVAMERPALGQEWVSRVTTSDGPELAVGGGAPDTSEMDFDQIAAAQGWNADTLVQLLREYISTEHVDDALDDFAREKAREENGDTSACDECGWEIPNTPGGGLENKHHDESCSLYNAEKE